MSNYPECSQTNEVEFEKPDFETLDSTENLTKKVKEIQRLIRTHSQRLCFLTTKNKIFL